MKATGVDARKKVWTRMNNSSAHNTGWSGQYMAVLAALLTITGLVGGIGAGTGVQQGEAAAKFKQVVSDYEKAKSEYDKAEKAAKNDAERKALKAERPNMGQFAERMLQIATGHSKDPAAYDALAWIVQNAPGSKVSDRAIDLLTANHVTDPQIGGVCRGLSEMRRPAAENLLRAILDRHPNRNPRGLACFWLAQALKREHEDATADKKKGKANTLYKQVVALYQRVENEFADVKGAGSTLGAAARGESFEFRLLQVGKPAPDITGEDIDGKEFKLSDYRGKVVVLEFWGNW
jgi:hypothetical protein